MAYAYAVEHMWGGDLNISLFKDRTQAENYASKYNGIVVDLWPVSNNNPSTPLSTTNEAACLVVEPTRMKKPTH